MDLVSVTDTTSAAIVLGGTLVATLLRCGFDDCALACRALLPAMPGTSRFDAGQVRAALAVQVRDIQQNGLLRAHPRHFGDPEFDDATAALIGQRSLQALLATHAQHQARRQLRAGVAARTLNQAAELAPVFGLAGTLVSLGKLPGDGLDRGSYMAAIAMAVHATLYGLIAANLVLAPLARLVDRRARREGAARQDLVDWLAHALADTRPPIREHAAHPSPAPARGHGGRAS